MTLLIIYSVLSTIAAVLFAAVYLDRSSQWKWKEPFLQAYCEQLEQEAVHALVWLNAANDMLRRREAERDHYMAKCSVVENQADGLFSYSFEAMNELHHAVEWLNAANDRVRELEKRDAERLKWKDAFKYGVMLQEQTVEWLNAANLRLNGIDYTNDLFEEICKPKVNPDCPLCGMFDAFDGMFKKWGSKS